MFDSIGQQPDNEKISGMNSKWPDRYFELSSSTSTPYVNVLSNNLGELKEQTFMVHISNCKMFISSL